MKKKPMEIYIFISFQQTFIDNRRLGNGELGAGAICPSPSHNNSFDVYG